jgi:hypothetical protein
MRLCSLYAIEGKLTNLNLMSKESRCKDLRMQIK